MSDALPPIDRATMPAAVRNGDQQRQREYQAAVSFERVLVGQLTDQLAKSFGGFGDEEGGDAASQQLKQTLPGTLADALMASGGIGLASQLDQLWHQGDHDGAVSTSLRATPAGQTTADAGAALGSAEA